MEPLPLAPLPSERSSDAMHFQRIQNQGFVDENVVLAVIASNSSRRPLTTPDDMALSSDAMDYAGWSLKTPTPQRTHHLAEKPKTPSTPIQPTKLPAAPVLVSTAESLKNPRPGKRRWWLFGLFSFIACCILSLIFFALAQHSIYQEPTAAYPASTPAPALAPTDHATKNSATGLLKTLFAKQ